MGFWDLHHGIDRSAWRVEEISLYALILVELPRFLKRAIVPLVKQGLVSVVVVRAPERRIHEEEHKGEASEERGLQQSCHVSNLVLGEVGESSEYPIDVHERHGSIQSTNIPSSEYLQY